MQACVAIAGGGPAGAALALELRRLGVACVVLARPRPLPCFEGMSERTARLLERCGLSHARAVLRPPGARQALWNGAVNRHNSEHLVERRALDRALLDDLRAYAVTVAETAVRSCQYRDQAWHIATDHGEWRADFLVEARGRAAPAGQGTCFRGPATIAVARLFQSEAADDATAIIPFQRGWAWLARGSDGVASIQFAIDAGDAPDGGKAGLTALHDALMAEVDGTCGWLAPEAAQRGEATARDCTAYLRDDLIGPAHLRLGDAACGLDPLSGQGVFLALAGAMSAAAVINTCVNRPQDAALAGDFYRQRVERQFFGKVGLGRDFYAMEQRWAEAPFWRARARLPLPETATDSPTARCRRPVREQGWVVERDVLVTPDHPLGVWRVEDVPVAELARAMAEADFSPLDYAVGHGHDPVAVRRAAVWIAQAGAVGA